MSDIVIIAFIAAVPSSIAAIASIINTRKLDTVHSAVNGGLKEARLEIKALKSKLRKLKRDKTSITSGD